MKIIHRLGVVLLLLNATFAFAQNKSPSAVTLAGTMQTLLGCSGNWQPECTHTHLTRQDDIWSASFTLPAGSWEYKIALDNNWSESYGYNQGSANASFSLSKETLVTFYYHQQTHLVTDSVNFPDGDSGDLPQPDRVTLAADFQQLLGCSGDWQADCAASDLQFNEAHQHWHNTWTLPAGDWQFKVALNGSWEESYGRFAASGGENIQLSLDEATEVTFIYEHGSHWITSSKNAWWLSVVGDFQTHLGCADNWAPDCWRSRLQDPDENGLYTLVTNRIPPGDYQAKVTRDGNWQTVWGDAQGNNLHFTVSETQPALHFTFDAINEQVYIGEAVNAGDLLRAKAFWVDATTLVWPLPEEALESARVRLHWHGQAGLASSPAGVTGGESLLLHYTGKQLPAAVAEKFPHLQGQPVFSVPSLAQEELAALVKSQLAVSAENSQGHLIDATALQIPGLLDDRFYEDGELGVSWQGDRPLFRLWAPTAQQVHLRVFSDSQTDAFIRVPLMENIDTGVWELAGEPGWNRHYYLYEVEVFVRHTGRVERNLVTDPYTLSAATNGKRSQVVNLQDADLLPPDWHSFTKPALDAPEDIVLYELHLRDFSIHDEQVPESLRGTYLAFTLDNSQGMNHLRQLAGAGLTHVHFLPLADCATIPEDKNDQRQLTLDLHAFAPDSSEQQAAVESIRGQDAFNWCYDPHHYNLPEGSYATNPEGVARILEFRTMVQALNRAGLRVVMDVVYNHTSGSLLGDTSVLDKVVPGYYHRLNAQGDIENSTCCANTATEHAMMEKLMLDSLRLWAVDYKVDGFRFDIMGHHSRDNLLKAKQQLQGLTLAEQGVDGSRIYLYGEGWNFGEVENNRRFVQASIENMAGTGIGTFNNRIRDVVRGGWPFDTGIDHVRTQSFINGLFLDPNSETHADEATRNQLLTRMDQLQAALAGSLQDYSLTNRHGQTLLARELDVDGQPAGYAADPQEVINYIEAHDNETLFDSIQYKAPLSASPQERVRMQNLGNSLLMFSQGIPFIHAGQELLRSKSMDRNSYDAGDWFNILDYSFTTNGWGRGLPLRQDNQTNWTVVQPLLADPQLAVSSDDIQRARDHMLELLAIRKSSGLFRLRSAEEVAQHVKFYQTGSAQVPGVIVMALEDPDNRVDNQWRQILVIFNADLTAQEVVLANRMGNRFALHPVQQESGDLRLAEAAFTSATGSFHVPARTTAVFVSADQPGTEPVVVPPPAQPEPVPVSKKKGGSLGWPLLLTLLLAASWRRRWSSRATG